MGGLDMDMQHYLHQEARTLRDHGWLVVEPRPNHTYCATEGCPVRTPRKFCHYCLKTMRLAA